MALVASGVASGISAGGALYTNWRNRKQVDRANKQQQANFERQLNYNSETSQMARRMAAGLHPMTMAGSQPTSAPSAPDYETYDLQNPFAGSIDAGQSAVQVAMQERELSMREKGLEVERLATAGDLAQVVGGLVDKGLTSAEITNLFQRVGVLQRDETIGSIEAGTFNLDILKQNLEASRLDNEQKRKALSWYDEIQKTQLDAVRAGIDLDQERAKTEQTIQKLNGVKADEARQAIKNLKGQLEKLSVDTEISRQEQISARVQAQFDSYIAEQIPTIAQSVVDKLVSTGAITQKEAKHYVTNMIIRALSGAISSAAGAFIGGSMK